MTHTVRIGPIDPDLLICSAVRMSNRHAVLTEKPEKRALADAVALSKMRGGCSFLVVVDDPGDQLRSKPPLDPLWLAGRGLRVQTMI
jgi:hypothetical protein